MVVTKIHGVILDVLATGKSSNFLLCSKMKAMCQARRYVVFIEVFLYERIISWLVRAMYTGGLQGQVAKAQDCGNYTYKEICSPSKCITNLGLEHTQGMSAEKKVGRCSLK